MPDLCSYLQLASIANMTHVIVVERFERAAAVPAHHVALDVQCPKIYSSHTQQDREAAQCGGYREIRSHMKGTGFPHIHSLPIPIPTYQDAQPLLFTLIKCL